MGWDKLVRDYNISYRRGSGGTNIEVHCPYCGDSDRSKHLGLHLESTSYGCWKGKSLHSGRNPAKLIRKLLNVSEEEALTISLNYFDISDYDFTKDKGRNRLLTTVQLPEIPAEFRKFATNSAEYLNLSEPDRLMQSQIGQYLKLRGYDPIFITQRFKLMFASSGDFVYRAIIPIFWNKNIMTWTSRTIISDVNPRYKASKTSIYSPDMFLFDSDNLTGGRALLVCEGVMDAMKVTSCMIPGVHATALFGMELSDQQMALLMSWSEIYDRIYLCLDKAEIKKSMSLQQKLSWYVPNIQVLSPNQKDFGETPISELTKEITQKCQ